MRRLKPFLSTLGNAITRLLCEDIPVTAPGSREMVDYYEEQLTRLSLAWLACRTGNRSEFGYRSQKELVRSFEGAVEGYQLHSRALRKRVEFAQCAFPLSSLSHTESQSGREPVTTSQEEPDSRPHLSVSLSGVE